jgi:hypothetical protein
VTYPQDFALAQSVLQARAESTQTMKTGKP